MDIIEDEHNLHEEELTKERNLAIHRRLGKIFEKFAPDYTDHFDLIGHGYEGWIALTFQFKNKQQYFYLESWPSYFAHERGLDFSGRDNITFEIGFGPWTPEGNPDADEVEFDLRQRESTYYGILPKYAIGADGKFYQFHNYYYIDDEGNGRNESCALSQDTLAKDYEVPNVTAEEFLRSMYHLEDDEIDRVKRIDFTPEEIHGGNFAHMLLPLNEYDYERIETVLTVVENGHAILKSIRRDIELDEE